MTFLASYLVLGVLLPSDFVADTPETTGSDDQKHDPETRLAGKVQALATSCMLDIRFKGFLASDVACAILYSARRSMGVLPAWRPELTAITLVDPTAEGMGPIMEILALLQGESLLPPVPPFAVAQQQPSFSTPLSPVPLCRNIDTAATDALSEYAREKLSKSKESPTSITAMTGELDRVGAPPSPPSQEDVASCRRALQL